VLRLPLKELCHEMNICFVGPKNSINDFNGADGLTIFGCLSVETIENKVSAWS
jgi:hypothetical protein